MDRRQRKPPGGGQAMEERQQRDRVGPARHRHDQVLTRNEQLLLMHRPNKLGNNTGRVADLDDSLMIVVSTAMVTELPAKYAAN